MSYQNSRVVGWVGGMSMISEMIISVNEFYSITGHAQLAILVLLTDRQQSK